jgi:glycopeptide antibiotics resistance protein
MGKREVRVVVVRKPVTVTLLIITSAAMIALVYILSGRAFERGGRSTADLVTLLAANVILFIPWGFLMFMALSPKRPRAMTYVVTLTAAALFALGIDVWQSTLPTPVTTSRDAIWNVVGAFLGAAGAHLRKSMRIRFQI